VRVADLTRTLALFEVLLAWTASLLHLDDAVHSEL
jgi:hypothetical protein